MLKRAGPTPLVSLAISGAQWRELTLAGAESQPPLQAASCPDAGLPAPVQKLASSMACFSTKSPGSHQKNPPWGGLTFTYLALGGHPPFLRVRRGSDPPEPFRRVLPLLGLCFLGFTMALISLLFGFRFVPLLPFSLPLVNDGKRTEGWVVRNIELSKPKATLATVEEH